MRACCGACASWDCAHGNTARKGDACGCCAVLLDLHLACSRRAQAVLVAPRRYGREECVRLLLAAGADITVTNDKGQTAAEVVKSEPRNPLNQNASLLAVLEGAAELASIQ